jgi:hypothetical protein
MALLAGLAVPGSHANVTYTYTGNLFNDFRNGGACPPVCNVTGAFTVAQPLLPNLASVAITPLSFSLSSAGITLTSGVPADSSLSITTNAQARITNWSWVEVGPASSPTARILTQNVPGFEFDDVRVGNQPPPFVGPVLGLLQNDPGTWSSVPEPASILLGGAGLLLTLGYRRKTL